MTSTAPDKHHAWSSLREEYVEYVFLGALCCEFWQRHVPVDVLRAHTDQGGFDIVLEAGPFQRHVQLKSSFVGSTTRRQKVNLRLEEKAGGCVVWVLFDRDTLAIQRFRWYGELDPRAPTKRLGERSARHTKGDAHGVKSVRPGIRTLVWGDFDDVEHVGDLATLLFPIDLLDSRSAEERQP